ncbi:MULTISPECIES: SRPBCC family protein [unclassified Mycobacterium]|uniref:SRPBCC family protein n=1 Tax=unclassified Mycobacterium TaxID=2642494 RepID=UPI0029C7889C|nr:MULTISPECIES: SRPBCC family protein [unclassified Mycobacterium]
MSDEVLQAQLDIDAPPAKVWALISDLSLMPRWSPQCRVMKAFGPLRVGTKTVNLNRRKLTYWPTTCRVTELEPEKKLAFRVNENNTVWSYELEPTSTGTRVVETRRADDGIKPASNFVVDKMFGGVPNFERELVDGMNASLRRLKAAAEGRREP